MQSPNLLFCERLPAGVRQTPMLPRGRSAMRMLFALVLPVLLIGPSAVSAQSATYDIPAHVSRVEGAAVLEREDGDEELESNLTLVEGDRVRTRSGRVEILFADGTLLHLDR